MTQKVYTDFWEMAEGTGALSLQGQMSVGNAALHRDASTTPERETAIRDLTGIVNDLDTLIARKNTGQELASDFFDTKARIEGYMPELKRNVAAGLVNADKFKDEASKERIEDLKIKVEQKFAALGWPFE